jgi:murein DD-endopeptidase MepM/ murein hydrolase activator NlpD
MGKYDFRFNEDTLNYEKVQKTWAERMKNFVVNTLTSLTMGFILVIMLYYYFDSPKEKSLKRENEQLLAQYTILDKKLNNATKVLGALEQRDDNIYRVIFEAEPIPASIRRAGTGGVDLYERLDNLNNSEIVISTSKKIDKLSKAIYIQSKSYDEIENMILNKQKMLASIPAILPIAIKDFKGINSSYGYRIHPIYKQRIAHMGMDFAGITNTPIYATGDGKAIHVGQERGYGKKIVIDHGYGYKTMYAHLNKFNIRRGQKIKRGEVIGYLGNTGISTGPHLHYEVRKNNRPVNPINYYFNDLTAETYDSIVEAAANTGQSMD